MKPGGIARFYTADATAGFGVSFPTLEWLTTGRLLGVPHSFIAMLLVAAVMWVVLHRSVFGRHLYAVGKDEEAARYSGIPSSLNFAVMGSVILIGVLADTHFAELRKRRAATRSVA